MSNVKFIKMLPIRLKINGNNAYNLVDMLKIFGNWWKGIEGGTIVCLFSFLWLCNQPFYMPPNLPRALRKGAVSSSFFFLLSFSQSASSSTCLIGFLPNLVRSKYGWMATKLHGSKNSSGVIWGHKGFKKMILRKTLLLLQITWYGLVTNLSCNGLTLSTKVMGLKIHPGSFGVTGVKNVNYYYLNDWIRRLTD